MTKANNRGSVLAQVDQRWLSIALAAAGGVAVADQANAAIVYHAPVGGISIPSTFAGIYINLETEAAGANSTVGWDVNPYGSSYLNIFKATGAAIAGGAAGFQNLAPGTPLSVATLVGATGNGPDAAFPVVVNSSSNLIGFKFTDAASVVHAGWMRISLSASTFSQPRSVVEWAYESDTNATINAGQVPAPGTLALLAAGGLGLTGRRRKTA